MPTGNCPYCFKGEIIYKIGQGINAGKCNKCGNPVAYTWLIEQVRGKRLNPNLVPNFNEIQKK